MRSILGISMIGSSALWTVAPVAYIRELFPPAKIIAFISVPPFSEL